MDNKIKKVRKVFYLDREASKILDKIYMRNIISGDKQSYSDIICDMIKGLCVKEENKIGEE